MMDSGTGDTYERPAAGTEPTMPIVWSCQLHFGPGIDPNQLRFQPSVNDLQIEAMGTKPGRVGAEGVTRHLGDS
jgi:hypothetical protein